MAASGHNVPKKYYEATRSELLYNPERRRQRKGKRGKKLSDAAARFAQMASTVARQTGLPPGCAAAHLLEGKKKKKSICGDACQLR